LFEAIVGRSPHWYALEAAVFNNRLRVPAHLQHVEARAPVYFRRACKGTQDVDGILPNTRTAVMYHTSIERYFHIAEKWVLRRLFARTNRLVVIKDQTW
jgi:hypothetical protein